MNRMAVALRGFHAAMNSAAYASRYGNTNAFRASIRRCSSVEDLLSTPAFGILAREAEVPVHRLEGTDLAVLGRATLIVSAASRCKDAGNFGHAMSALDRSGRNIVSSSRAATVLQSPTAEDAMDATISVLRLLDGHGKAWVNPEDIVQAMWDWDRRGRLWSMNYYYAAAAA